MYVNSLNLYVKLYSSRLHEYELVHIWFLFLKHVAEVLNIYFLYIWHDL